MSLIIIYNAGNTMTNNHPGPLLKKNCTFPSCGITAFVTPIILLASTHVESSVVLLSPRVIKHFSPLSKVFVPTTL